VPRVSQSERSLSLYAHTIPEGTGRIDMMSRRALRILVGALIWMGVLVIPSCLNFCRKNDLGSAPGDGERKLWEQMDGVES